MKSSIKIAVKLYKYLFVLYLIAFWVYIIIDDYVFIEKYWSTRWLEYIGGWFIYFLLFFIGLSIYYWVTTMVLIIFLHYKKKFSLRNKTKNGNAQ